MRFDSRVPSLASSVVLLGCNMADPVTASSSSLGRTSEQDAASGRETGTPSAGLDAGRMSFDAGTGEGSSLPPAGALGNCANLPVGGRWENISPVVAPAVDAGATFSAGFSEGVVVDPFDPGTVWLGTGYRGLFKSTDCGATWSMVSVGRNGGSISNGSLISMTVDPVARGTLYVVPIFSAWGLWKSTNGGVDWENLFPQGSEVYKATNGEVDSISMDRNNHLHLVVGFHTNCSAPYAPTCEAETTDGGKTWRLVKTPNANWEEGGGPWVLGAKSWLYGGSELWLTTDGGGSWTKVTPPGTWAFAGGEVETHPIPRGSDGTYYLTSSQGITRSRDGRTWSLIPNFTKRVVGFASGDGRFFVSDQWSNGYHSASAGDPATWSAVAPPPALPSDQGAPYLDYDASHHILYSSNFAGGLWRVVIAKDAK